jgi:hypothetical protein
LAELAQQGNKPVPFDSRLVHHLFLVYTGHMGDNSGSLLLANGLESRPYDEARADSVDDLAVQGVTASGRARAKCGANLPTFGISWQAFYKWQRRYEQHGEAGVGDQPRTPNRSPRSTPSEVVSKILYLRQNYHFGPARLPIT